MLRGVSRMPQTVMTRHDTRSALPKLAAKRQRSDPAAAAAAAAAAAPAVELRDDSDLEGLGGDAEEELLPNDSDLEERFGAAARARRAAAAAAAVGGQPVEAAGA